MKKASKLFQGFVNKGKSMFNTKKDHTAAPAQSKIEKDENGFSSGEDDDLIEIGKDKGASLGAKSVL